jgi:predicted methyltransferase
VHVEEGGATAAVTRNRVAVQVKEQPMLIPHGAARAALLATFAAAALAGCASMAGEDPKAAAERYAKVIASPVRTDWDRTMAASRDPADFLPFTQARPGMVALDVSAGAGYTSQLIALAVLPDGKLYAQTPRPGPGLMLRVAERPQANFIIVERPFEDPVPPDAPPLDLITIVNNYHDITYLQVDRAKMNQRLFAALKRGGRLVVVDHSGRPGTGVSEGRTLHRIDEAVVKSELRQAGFVLDAEGAFLRNPADDRTESSNQPKVPTDKFVLRFVKP